MHENTPSPGVMRRFDGRAALITAAGQGIGRAIALRLADEGANVVVTDRSDQAAHHVADEIRTAGGRAIARQLDVTRRADIDASVEGAITEFGRLDILVNNAGGNILATEPAETDASDWRRQLDLTLVATAECIQAALPPLQEFRGNVVTIGSVNAQVAVGNIEYSAAKAGQISVTQNLAAYYGPRGVRFNVVSPGTVRTPNWDHQAAHLERMATMYPLGRVGEPADIAAAVAFLASDDAAWITGITLPVEGGLMTGPFRPANPLPQ